MNDLTAIEKRVYKQVEKLGAIALAENEDFADFKDFDKSEHSQIEPALESLVGKRKIFRGRTPGSYSIFKPR